jgi:hypothetical protein
VLQTTHNLHPRPSYPSYCKKTRFSVYWRFGKILKNSEKKAKVREQKADFAHHIGERPRPTGVGNVWKRDVIRLWLG